MNTMAKESVRRIVLILEGGQLGHNYLAEVSSAEPGNESKDEVLTALRDLMTDIHHFADAKGLDFDSAVQGSLEVYTEEHATE